MHVCNPENVVNRKKAKHIKRSIKKAKSVVGSGDGVRAGGSVWPSKDASD